MNSEQGGKNLVWINQFQPISDDNENSKEKDSEQGRLYKGHWRSDMSMWEGLGIVKFPDGSSFKGQTKSGLFNGKGRMIHANGDIYQGEWQDGKANGHGVFVDTNGSMYEGEWKEDLQDGYGTESWSYNKIKYMGDFKEGKKTGTGRFEFEGGYYEGEFLDG